MGGFELGTVDARGSRSGVHFGGPGVPVFATLIAGV